MEFTEFLEDRQLRLQRCLLVVVLYINTSAIITYIIYGIADPNHKLQ